MQTRSYFNPRARVGRDDDVARLGRVHHISIHAPAWGATASSRSTAASRQFQSTRPRGARPCGRTSLARDSDFNPRARVGRDTTSRCCEPTGEISIHAPAWGATAGSLRYSLRVIFQSTRPRGARQRGVLPAPPLPHFNPRARVGRDPMSDFSSCREATFQSTRPRGARLRYMGVRKILVKISIHAPAWGAT